MNQNTDLKSWRECVKSSTLEEIQILINSLNEDELEKFYTDWTIWARDEQLQPQTNWFIWLILTGRGWGKTRTGAEFIIDRVKQGYKRIAIVGQTKADVRDTMIEIGESALLNVAPKNLMPDYEPSKRRLEWKNGAIAIVYSGDEPNQLRGPQHDTAWVDELAKFKYPEETWDNLEFGLRLSENPRAVITTTPRPIPIIKKLIKDKSVYITRGKIYENINNLPKAYLDRMRDKYEGTRLGRQELNGEILEETQGALWTLKLIDKLRVNEAPKLKRIGVAIDPEATSTEESAETGIIGAGLGEDGHGYVLADSSIRARPNVWASQAIKLLNSLKADFIIAEINNGGEMVETVIKTVDSNVNYEGIHASRGKRTRAEPVSALYEQGKIHHVGTFSDLEDQMCNWIPGEKSPDRMDALVWVITKLMIGIKEPKITLI